MLLAVGLRLPLYRTSNAAVEFILLEVVVRRPELAASLREPALHWIERRVQSFRLLRKEGQLSVQHAKAAKWCTR
jgi:hypothetical protein